MQQRDISPLSPLKWRDSFKRSLSAPLSALTVLAAAFLSLDVHATSLFRWEDRREAVGALRIIPELSFQSTTENYDSTGAKTAVPGLTSYKKTGLDIWGVYGVTPKLTGFARLSFTGITFQTTTTSSVPSYISLDGSGSGLGEQSLGLNYRLWNSAPKRASDGSIARSSAIDGQIQADIPMYDNVDARRQNPRLPLRGDGSLDLTLGVFGTMPLNQGAGQRLFGIAGLGFMSRTNNYSKAIPYQLQLVGLPERDGITYRLGIHGFKSMTSDPASGTQLSPQSIATSGVVDQYDAGGSYIVDALNSSYMTVRATLGYQWGQGNQLYATYVLPMSGTSTAAIKEIILGAQFRFPGARTAPAAGTTKTRSAGTYDLEARVKQANDRLNLVKIDRGANDGIAKGHVIDIYRTNPDGSQADLIARGVVTSVSDTEAVVNLRQYKKEVWVQPGYIARRIAPQKTR